MRKQYLGFIESYNMATAHTLSDVYGTCSIKKRNAERWCHEKMQNMNGYDFRILSANSYAFTCAWRYRNMFGQECLNVETANHSYYFEMA